MAKYSVVFHLDESAWARTSTVISNVENLIADLGEGNVEVEVVATGEGITAYLRVPSLHGQRFERLGARGVRLVACANSLRAAGLPKEAMLASVEVVPSGVGELVRKQAEGWAYVRP